MNIGFDIDGVLTNIEDFQLKYGARHFRKKYNRSVVNRESYGIKEIFYCSDRMETHFWIKHMLKYVFSVPPRAGAVQTIQQLRGEGHNIYIITSRGRTTESGFLGKVMRGLVYYWLKRWGIPYDRITFCSIDRSQEDKVDACFIHGIDVIVEDKKENVEALAKVTNVIYFATLNNREWRDQKIIRVETFNEVKDQINKLKESDIKNTEVYHIKHHFNRLDREARKQLVKPALLAYYRQLKHHYLSLPFDKKAFEKHRKNNKVLSWFFRPLFFFVHQQVIHSHWLPKDDGFIIAASHVHEWDTLLPVRGVLGGKACHLLIKHEVLHQKSGALFRSMGSVFVDRKDKQSRRTAKDELVKLILHGGNILIFPEGTINRTADKLLLDFKYGAVDIAQITGAPIIPAAINKNYQLFGRKLFIRFGEPIHVNVGDDLTEANHRLKGAIRQLILDNRKLENESGRLVKKLQTK